MPFFSYSENLGDQAMKADATSVFKELMQKMKREGEIRIPSGCAIAGVFTKADEKISGGLIVDAMSVMHERSNGLGGGFAGYGIYPEYKDYYALHVFYETKSAREECERYIDENFEIINLSKTIKIFQHNLP